MVGIHADIRRDMERLFSDLMRGQIGILLERARRGHGIIAAGADCRHAVIGRNDLARTGHDEQFRECLFGDMDEAIRSDKNPRVLVERLAAMKKENPETPLPKIYMAIGEDDFLLKSNHIYKKLFEDGGFDLTYIEAPGDHNWDFWDTYIKTAIEWLPLGEGSEGMGSGNIAVKK